VANEGRVFAAGVGLRVVGEVVVEVPVEQVLVRAQQEGPGAAGGVHHAQVESLGGSHRSVRAGVAKHPDAGGVSGHTAHGF